MAQMTTKEVKKQLRKDMAAKLALISGQSQVDQSESVVQKILTSDWFQQSKRISVYVNTSGEIITDKLVKHCLQHDKQLFVPQFRKGENRMRMLRLSTMEQFDNLDTTLWNIRQPAQDCSSPEYIESGPLDLVLMPGVAFTVDGRRLGHGMGFYDRFLDEHKSKFGSYPKTMALALQEQILEDVPTSEFDVIVDKIVHP